MFVQNVGGYEDMKYCGENVTLSRRDLSVERLDRVPICWKSDAYSP